MLKTVNRLILIIIATVVSACQMPFPKAQTPLRPAIPVVNKPAKPVETQQQLALRMLLLNGEYALTQDQLITPVKDNALHYFRAVLKVDPNNARAKGGLQGIVLRYVDLARQAAARGSYIQANTMLNNARIVDPENLLIKEVAAGLTEQIKAAPPVAAYAGGANEFLLDNQLLSKKDPKIISKLADIAHKLKATDSLAMIIARTDVEGRWIYQQLRAAVPGYLVRGDIKLGSPPRVQLVARVNSAQ